MKKGSFTKDHGSPELFYRKFYKSIIFEQGYASWAISKTHQSMEKAYTGKNFNTVLEIGGGNGEHINFVRHSFERYFLTDIREPILDKKVGANPRIICEIANAQDLPYASKTFDRVIVTCLLHHVDKPEKVMEEILRVLKPDGVATIFLSCDPGIALRILRALSTSRSAAKGGFEGYDLMIAREHRNHVGSLLKMINFVFRHRRVKTKYFPFWFSSWNFNGYIVIHVS